MLQLIRFHWRLAGAALSAVIGFRLLLWIAPYRWIRRLGVLDIVPLQTTCDLQRRHRIAAAVRIMSHWVPGATCLTQALATQTLLRLKGDAVPLQLGVARSKRGVFEAHAWLESEGKVLIGDLPDLDRYIKLGIGLPTS